MQIICCFEPLCNVMTFTFSHLADAFIQSDSHMCDLECIHILYFTFTLMAHCTSGANSGFSVLLKDASTGNRTSNLLITKRLLYLLYHCRFEVLLHSQGPPAQGITCTGPSEV